MSRQGENLHVILVNLHQSYVVKLLFGDTNRVSAASDVSDAAFVVDAPQARHTYMRIFNTLGRASRALTSVAVAIKIETSSASRLVDQLGTHK